MFDPPFPPDRTPPHRLRCDVAVLGAGFGGSLIACCLRATGRSVALIDSGRLPRFALGETLSPHAAALLTALAERYRLNWLPPLLNPADGDRGGPGVRSGRHRGTVWVPIGTSGGKAGGEEAGAPLIVPAVGLGGALWHRGDVDAFAAARAVAADTVFFDRTALHTAARRSGGGYVLTGTRDERGVAPAGFVHKPASPVRIEADFLIDAGPPGGMPRPKGDTGLAGLLGLPDGLSTLASRTRLTFAHLNDLDPPNLPIVGQSDPAVETVVHHVFADGWYRELRFADGTASVARSGLFEEPVSGAAEANDSDADPFRLVGWGGLAERHGRSALAGPETGPCSPGRFQRRVGRVAGADFALLPAAAAAVDPLHDTDLTHTAAAVLRLAALLDDNWGRPSRAAALERYAGTLDRELTRIDGLAAPAYAALGDWETFRLAVQLHEAAAAGTESAGLALEEDGGEFLLAGDANFTAAASDFAAGVGRLGAAELAAALWVRLPHAADRFVTPA